MRTQELTHSVDDNPAVASAVLRSPKERNLADLLRAKLDLVVACCEIAETTNDGQRRAQLLFKIRQAIHTVRRLAAGIADQAAWRMIHKRLISWKHVSPRCGHNILEDVHLIIRNNQEDEGSCVECFMDTIISGGGTYLRALVSC